MTKKVEMVCNECGSTSVHADAYAVWNVDAQQWELETQFDKNAYCDGCGGECQIVERDIEAVAHG